MGMDVYGNNPRSEKGEYFRNNVWWWHPLWSYIEATFPELASKVENGHSNDGSGLNAHDSYKLSQLLKIKLKDGSVAEYEKEYNDELQILRVELEAAQNKVRELSLNSSQEEIEKKVKELEFDTGYWALHYPFSEENVKEFAEFLEFCGGFKIC